VLGRPASAVVVCGGAAADGRLPQLLAAVLGREVHVAAGAAGVAAAGSLLVARAAGAQVRTPELPETVLSAGDPEPHDDRYARWCAAHAALRTALPEQDS